MEQQVLFGLGILAILATWRWMYKPSLLDTTRDKLFDLRDDVRAHFIAKGYPLDGRVYGALRDLLNGHLLHTNTLSFMHYVAITAWMQMNREEAGAMQEKMNRRFKTDDRELAEYVQSVRRRAAMIMLDYMVLKSPTVMALAAIGSVVMFVAGIRKALVSLFSGMKGAKFSFARAAVLASSLLAITSHIGLGSRAVAQEAMEECALHSIA